VLSVAYLGLAPDLPASTEAHMSWQPVDSLTEMAFDHRRIVLDGTPAASSLVWETCG
jgi:8-oxo-dGTP diphosphatase